MTRQAVTRPRRVEFTLTQQEFSELDATGQPSADLLPYAAECTRRADAWTPRRKNSADRFRDRKAARGRHPPG